MRLEHDGIAASAGSKEVNEVTVHCANKIQDAQNIQFIPKKGLKQKQKVKLCKRTFSSRSRPHIERDLPLCKDCTATYFSNSRIKFLHVKLQRMSLFWYLKNLNLLKHLENPEKSLWDTEYMIRNEISTCICESTNDADDGHFRKCQTQSACSKIA